MASSKLKVNASGATEATNDENACPNRRTEQSPVKYKNRANNNKRSPQRAGPSVAKLAALFDANKKSSCNNNTSSSTFKQTRQHSSGSISGTNKKAPVLRSVSYNSNDNTREREQRRRLMLQERQSQKGLSISSIIESDLGAELVTSGRLLLGTKCERKLVAIETNKANGLKEAHAETLVVTKKAKIQQNTSDELSVKARADVTAMTKNIPPSAVPLGQCTVSSKNRRRGVTRVLAFVSQLILLVLAVYEVHHYYYLFPTAAIFDMISEMTGWDDVFHVGFVVAFCIRALLASFTMTARWLSKKDEKGGNSSHYLHATLLFFFFASCWMALLPIFKDCGSEVNSASHFCFFVERSSKRLKRKVAQQVLTISSPRYSVLDLLAREWYKNTKFIIKSKVKGRVMREIQKALLRPFAFRGKLKKLFMVLRWAKFLAPLVGTCNKFRGHLLDLYKKRRQRITSRAAQKRWNDLLDAISKRSKLERSVLKLQKRFRERRESKAKRRFALMSPSRDTSNRKVAHQIRKRLVEEQRSSRSKLRKMELLDSQRKLRREVSQDERRNITKHKESERKLKKRLLLSPKTSFAVEWKYFTLACVALEISQIIFAPMLSGELKKMPLDKFLLRVLNASSHCDGKNKRATAPSIFIPVVNNFDDITCNTSSKQTWLIAAHVIATILVPAVNTIFFLDVFITFFTGELTPSGTLVPKPLFARYLLPGIGLQLIVNPTMIEISRLVKQTLVHFMHIGPSLSFHLLLACIPFAAYSHNRLLDLIFDFVEKQNKI
eukprot:CAMPEP_0172327314 /NCGR_PEP_ID=MMETSP1058-20130122/59222_1 /TAXON_ID=83371 /ORGANISM="Detonula confervacea, Strain CCMP 353" /LENGTH=777 /DNA_ID=CAMNT_0013044327 /DNA_START=53 /DNA_END=2383 /DNA_ORIENTATION=+